MDRKYVFTFYPVSQFTVVQFCLAITRVYPGGAESRTELQGKITGYTDTSKTMERVRLQSKGTDFYLTVADREKAEN